jgi:hypothetical protein
VSPCPEVFRQRRRAKEKEERQRWGCASMLMQLTHSRKRLGSSTLLSLSVYKQVRTVRNREKLLSQFPFHSACTATRRREREVRERQRAAAAEEERLQLQREAQAKKEAAVKMAKRRVKRPNMFDLGTHVVGLYTLTPPDP